MAKITYGHLWQAVILRYLRVPAPMELGQILVAAGNPARLIRSLLL